MNEVLQLAHLRNPQVAGTASTHLEEHRRQELYALWQGIFEHAAAVPLERAVEVTYRSPPMQRETVVAGSLPSDSLPGVRIQERAPAQLRAAPIRTTAAVRIAHHVGDASPGCAVMQRTAASGAAASIPRALPSAPSVEPERSAAAAAVQPHTATLSFAPPAAVSVFVSGGTVRIVVRDGLLAEEEALRTAFETAGALAGRRAALQQLTLNGQVLYRHGGDDTGRSAVASMFA